MSVARVASVRAWLGLKGSLPKSKARSVFVPEGLNERSDSTELAEVLALRAWLPSIPSSFVVLNYGGQAGTKAERRVNLRTSAKPSEVSGALVASISAYRILRTDFQGGFRCR
jgi:hypothetical protein